MFKSLNHLQSSIEEPSEIDKKQLEQFSQKLNSLVKEGKYEESISYAKNALNQLSQNKSEIVRNCYKHEIIRQLNIYIVFLLNGNNPLVKKLFLECGEYINRNISSYLITMTNYSCYLVRNNHARQSKSVIKKVHTINLVHFLNKDSQGTLEEVGKSYSNLSSINNSNKSQEEALMNGMESLAINQLACLLNKTKSDQLSLVYYSIGTQQEFQNRFEDGKSSFARAQHYLGKFVKDNKDSGKKGNYAFIEKIKTQKDDVHTIKESLNNPELTFLKCRKADLFANINKMKFQDKATYKVSHLLE